jgi:hypothetical protein
MDGGSMSRNIITDLSLRGGGADNSNSPMSSSSSSGNTIDTPMADTSSPALPPSPTTSTGTSMHTDETGSSSSSNSNTAVSITPNDSIDTAAPKPSQTDTVDTVEPVTTSGTTTVATMTTTDSLNPTNTNTNTTLVDAATAVIQNIGSTILTMTTSSLRTTYENILPYIPINTKYNLATVTVSQQHHQHHSIIMSIAALLAMNSGYLNGLGLYGISKALITATSFQAVSSSSSTPTGVTTTTIVSPQVQAVAAVTSAYTNLGLQLAQGNLFTTATIPLRLIGSYLLGATVTGFLVHHPPSVPYEINTYPVSTIFAIGTIVLFMVSSQLSSSSAPLSSMKIFYLLTFINGLQNSLTSIYSNNQIRSSHYTGMTSDTGTFLGQYIRSSFSSDTNNDSDNIVQKNIELKKALLPKISRNTILSLSFIMGGMLSYWMSQPSHIQHANIVLLPSLVLYMIFTVLSLLWKPTTTTMSPVLSPA